MPDKKKVRYLKIDRGRYYYQRRVPEPFQDLLGITKWQKPCGDVSYAKAVQLVVTWAEEHNDLLARLKTKEGYKAIEAEYLRSEDEAFRRSLEPDSDGKALQRIYEEDGEIKTLETVVRPWRLALEAVKDLDIEKANESAPDYLLNQLKAKLDRAMEAQAELGKLALPPYPELVKIAEERSDIKHLVQFEFSSELQRSMSDERYFDRLTAILEEFFGEQGTLPSDPDDRDEYIFAKRKIERKLASVAPDPNSISAVLEAYCRFNSIRAQAASKYRRDVGRLIKITGDVPLAHVRTDDLKSLRDELIGTIKAASLHAIFTPIKGIFGFAFDEGWTCHVSVPPQVLV